MRALIDSKANLRVVDRDITFSQEAGVEGDDLLRTHVPLRPETGVPRLGGHTLDEEKGAEQQQQRMDFHGCSVCCAI